MVVLLGRPQIDLIDFVMGKLFILAIKSCADQWVEQCRRYGSPPWAPRTMAREMSYMEMASTHVSALPKGVSPLEDEIWKQRLPALVWSRIRSWYLLDWCGFIIDLNRRCEVAQSGGLGSLRAVTADKIFVELHFVLATKRFNVRSMRKQRLLVIVISPNNFSCWCDLPSG